MFVVGALSLMKVEERRSVRKQRNFRQDIMEGLRYARQTPVIRNTLALVGVLGVTARNLSILVPVLAKDALQLSASGYGVLMSFMGAGALLGAMSLAWFSHRGPLRSVLYGGALALTALEVVTAFSGGYWSSCLLLFFIGWANITYGATANSSLQVNAPDHLRGRVMSLYSLLNGGSSPVGNLFAGITTGIYGAFGGFLACGGTGLLATALLWLMERRGGDVAEPIAESKSG